jgi:hypothetical protein
MPQTKCPAAVALANRAALVLASVAQLRKAVAKLHAAAYGPDDAAVAGLERTTSVLEARAAELKADAGRLELESKPKPPARETEADFLAAARAARPDYDRLPEDIWARTQALWQELSMPAAAFWALSPEQRKAKAAEHKAAIDTRLSGAGKPAPSTARKTKPSPKAKGPATGGLAAYRRLLAECKAAGLPTRGTSAELTARLAAAPAAKPEHPAAGTVFIADGKGGVRPATSADAELLASLLDQWTAPTAKTAA